MTKVKTMVAGVSVLALLAGCAGTPLGPTVRVMPAPNKPFEVFQADQASCKQYAEQQVGGQAEAANNQAVGATLLGAALGAGLGAAVGGGRGAGVGAAAGGLMGTEVGAGGSAHAQRSIQAQYDNAFAQCMSSKGNQVQQPVVVQTPVYVVPPPVVYAPPPPVVYAPPPPTYSPPPPPGYAPPPPPPGYAPPNGQ